MLRAKLLAALGVMALSGAFAAATATPLPIASQAEMESMAGTVDYRRCIWADGHRLCRTYYEDAYGGNPAVPEYGYYGAPGIYLGYGGFGAGRGPLDDGDGR